jgi:hypothetical protein
MSPRTINIIEASPSPLDWIAVAEAYALPFVIFLAATAVVFVIIHKGEGSP